MSLCVLALFNCAMSLIDVNINPELHYVGGINYLYKGVMAL
jgi:hypothetical protein